MTVAIAAYAAIVSTIAVGWQVFTWRRSHTTRVRVELSNAFTTPDFRRTISVTAYNDNDHDVRVTSWGFEANDGSGDSALCIQPLPWSQLPGTVGAHDSKIGIQDWEAAQSPVLDFKRPVTAWVTLSNGKRFRSKSKTLAA
jgi:hypothetical protein